MMDNLIGVWLPKEANVIFKDSKPNFVNLLKKNEDGVHQIILGTTEDFDAGEYEQFYILRVPQLPQQPKEIEETPKEEE